MGLGADSLRTLLKANLHADTTISDPGDLNTFLTLGQQQMVRDSPGTLGVKEGSLSLTAALGRTYSLAADFYQMRGVFFATNNYRLAFVPMSRWMDEVESLSSISSAAPDAYTISGADATGVWNIKFNYAPDASYTYKYWYWWMPAAISGTAVPPVSGIGFDDVLLWAATMKGRERNDPDGYVQARDMYERGMAAYREFGAAQPDWWIVQSPGFARAGSTLRLDPSIYPDW